MKKAISTSVYLFVYLSLTFCQTSKNTIGFGVGIAAVSVVPNKKGIHLEGNFTTKIYKNFHLNTNLNMTFASGTGWGFTENDLRYFAVGQNIPTVNSQSIFLNGIKEFQAHTRQASYFTGQIGVQYEFLKSQNHSFQAGLGLLLAYTVQTQIQEDAIVELKNYIGFSPVPVRFKIVAPVYLRTLSSGYCINLQYRYFFKKNVSLGLKTGLQRFAMADDYIADFSVLTGFRF